MEELQKKHRQEVRDLQSRVTQKKRNATKKTRKGVNDECAELERQLSLRQTAELAAFRGSPEPLGHVAEATNVDGIANEAGILEAHQPPVPLASDKELSVLPASGPTSNGHAKKPNRQKARLARRAAEQAAAVEQAKEEAANLPDLREKEQKGMHEAFDARGLFEQEMRPDGHCLYAAVADQIQHSGIDLVPNRPNNVGDLQSLKGYRLTRAVAAKYILTHSDDFQPFLEEPLEDHVRMVRETGEWGGHLEILALAKAYSVNINVLQGDGRVEQISGGDNDQAPLLWLAYYRHSHGLGEHYNSLRVHNPGI